MNKEKKPRLRCGQAVILLLIMISSLFVPFSANATTINVNPSLSVINSKLETIARAKNIPSLILKAIAFRESTWHQWDAQGNPILSAGSHPAIGIMQIASYNDSDTVTIDNLKNNIDINISKGADILNEKWDMVPKIGNGDRNILENWYFAIWAYNYWIKDGNSKNNPNQVPIGQKTYQDSILDLCSTQFMPSVPGAMTPVFISRPPLTDIPTTGVPHPISTPTPFHYGTVGGSSGRTLTVKRLGGDDRIATAIVIAQEGWPNPNPSGTSTLTRVMIARSDDYADALAGASLAAKYNAPILITPSHALDPRVLAEIQREKPQEVVVLGGEGALGAEVILALQQGGIPASQIRRIQGSDRYETAAAIAEQLGTTNGSAYIVTGENFPDAIGAATVAAEKGAPVILMPSDRIASISITELKRLKIQHVDVVGFNDVSFSLIKKEIQRQSPQIEVTSLRGADRYATTVALVKTRPGLVSKIYLATGEKFPDALAGAALTAHSEAVLLLVPEDNLEAQLELVAYIKEHAMDITTLGVFGSSNVIKDPLVNQVIKMLIPT